MTKYVVTFLLGFQCMPGLFAQGSFVDTLWHIARTYPDFFTNIVSKYYPLEEEDIEKYQAILKFYSIAGNTRIAWTDQLVDRYKDQWGSYGVLRNPKIDWSFDRIKLYADEKWFKWSDVCFNRRVYLPQDYYDQVKKGIFPQIIADSDREGFVLLYCQYDEKSYEADSLKALFRDEQGWKTASGPGWDTLRALAETRIADIEPEFLVAYADYLNWWKISRSPHIDWDYDVMQLFGHRLNLWDFQRLEEPIRRLFIDRMDRKTLWLILDELGGLKNQYYEIVDRIPGGDYGADAQYRGRPNKQFTQIEQKFDYFPDTLKISRFKLPGRYTWPMKFCDIHELNSWNRKIPIRLVSPRLKELLEQFSLPRHKFYPVKLELDSYWWGYEERDYFLFLCDTLAEPLFKVSSVTLIRKGLFENELKPVSQADMDTLRKQSVRRIEHMRREEDGFQVAGFHITEPLDLISVGSSYLWVSSRLAAYFDAQDFNGLYIESFPSMEIVGTSNPARVPCSTRNDSTIITQLAFQRFEQVSDSLNTLLQVSDFEDYVTSHFPEVQLLEFEKQNEVILPQAYRQLLLDQETWRLRDYSRDYYWNELSNMEMVHSDWYQYFPNLEKSVSIGWDGSGNYLVLILRDHNPFELSDMIYKLEHEIGHLIPFKQLK